MGWLFHIWVTFSTCIKVEFFIFGKRFLHVLGQSFPHLGRIFTCIEVKFFTYIESSFIHVCEWFHSYIENSFIQVILLMY